MLITWQREISVWYETGGEKGGRRCVRPVVTHIVAVNRVWQCPSYLSLSPRVSTSARSLPSPTTDKPCLPRCPRKLIVLAAILRPAFSRTTWSWAVGRSHTSQRRASLAPNAQPPQSSPRPSSIPRKRQISATSLTIL